MSPNQLLDDTARQCREVAEQYIRRYNWQLLGSDVLARQSLELLRSATAANASTAVLGAYCSALYMACSGAEGALRQNLAYIELGTYLRGLVITRYSDLRIDLYEDLVQSSLERIYRGFGNCREPVAFFAFAAQHLLDAVRAARRRERRSEESLDRAVAGVDASTTEILGLSGGAPGLSSQTRRVAIEVLFDEFLRAHPRATQQVTVLRMSVLEGYEDTTIAERLQISLASVQTARSRILKTLRDEPVWIERARNLGIFDDEV